MYIYSINEWITFLDECVPPLVIDINSSLNNMKINLLLGLFLVLSVSVFAQLPSDLSNIKSSEIADEQLLQFIQKAQLSGMSESDIMAQFKQRGLPDTESQDLSKRVNNLLENAAVNKPSTVLSSKETGASALVLQNKTVEPSNVFGVDLFASSNPLFVSNLNIATPANYMVGPGDELILEIFGNNISSQKLMVSREGFINVKYAGLVKASGYTIEDLNTLLRASVTSTLI